MSFASGALNTILFVFVLFGVYGALAVTDDAWAIAQAGTESAENGASLACYVISYASVTPALRIDWLPPEGTYWFLLEDIPFPDGTDFLVLGVLVSIAIFFLRRTVLKEQRPKLKAYVVSASIVLGVIVVGWVLLKLIAFFLMLGCGQSIGLTQEAILAGRAAAIEGVSAAGAVIPSLMLALFSGVASVRTFLRGGNVK